MAIYNVMLSATAMVPVYAWVEVEADSPEEAEVAAQGKVENDRSDINWEMTNYRNLTRTTANMRESDPDFAVEVHECHNVDLIGDGEG